MEKELTSLLLQVAAIGLIGYVAFFKTYFSEKGKNMATKEDVKELTFLVEQTKQQFTSGIELLRTRLNLYHASFTSIKTLERDALIKINTAYSEWANSLVTFSLAFYFYDNYEPLKTKDLFFNEKYMAFKVAEDNLHLYAHDEELRNILTKITQATLELQESVLSHITKFILNCKTYNDLRSMAPEGDHQQLNSNYHTLQTPLIEKSTTESHRLYLIAYDYQIKLIKNLNYRIYQLIGVQPDL